MRGVKGGELIVSYFSAITSRRSRVQLTINLESINVCTMINCCRKSDQQEVFSTRVHCGNDRWLTEPFWSSCQYGGQQRQHLSRVRAGRLASQNVTLARPRPG